MTVSNTTSKPTTSNVSSTSSSTSSARTHTVKKGENLWSIAQQQSGGKTNAEVQRYHQDLINANPQLKDPNLIRPGQELNLPDTGAANGARPSRLKPAVQNATGAPASSSFAPSSSEPPPQTARPNGAAPSAHPPISSELADEVTARRLGANTNPAGRARTRAPTEEEVQETEAQEAAQQPSNSMSGRPPGGRAVMPDANIYGNNRRGVHESGRDVRSGIERSHSQSSTTENRFTQQSRTTNSETSETAPRTDGSPQSTRQLQEETELRNRATGESASERTTVAQDQDGNFASRTTSESTEADDRRALDRLAEENGGSSAVAYTGVIAADDAVIGDNKFHGVNDDLVVDHRHEGNGTGAGYEAHALAARGQAGYAATVDLERGEVNLMGTASAQADLVGVSGRAQVGDRTTVAGQGFAEGEAHIGARAEGTAGVVISPNNVALRAQGEAFVGAEVKGTVGYENRYGGVSVTGRAQAGAGVAGGVDIGYNNGTVGVYADFGAAVGLGGRLTVDVNVNVGAIASDVASAASDFAGDVADGARSAFSAINPFD